MCEILKLQKCRDGGHLAFFAVKTCHSYYSLPFTNPTTLGNTYHIPNSSLSHSWENLLRRATYIIQYRFLILMTQSAYSEYGKLSASHSESFILFAVRTWDKENSVFYSTCRSQYFASESMYRCTWLPISIKKNVGISRSFWL